VTDHVIERLSIKSTGSTSNGTKRKSLQERLMMPQNVKDDSYAVNGNEKIIELHAHV
jgi:hypothetical protein